LLSSGEIIRLFMGRSTLGIPSQRFRAFSDVGSNFLE
jgi:hypothetical protein